jgi:hypothetical protein
VTKESPVWWSTPVDLYCERTDSSFWAEPVNALSNVSFLLAALLAFRAWRQRSADPGVLLLILVTATIGVGSFTFHTVATRGAALADTIPIAIFIYGYLLWALRRLFGIGWAWSLLMVAAFAASAQAFAGMVPRSALNGSHAYLPALAALLAVGWLKQRERAGRIMLAAAAILAASLILRTIDLQVCDALPLGTHFAWHLLNGLVLYLLLHAAMPPRLAKAIP